MHKKVLGLALAVGMFAIATPAFVGVLPCTSGVGLPLLVDATQNITNDVDSGNHGNWALDTYTRHIQIWRDADGTTYCAQVDYNGIFHAPAGVLSPQAGNPITGAIDGTIVGGYTDAITGSTTTSPVIPTSLDYGGTLANIATWTQAQLPLAYKGGTSANWRDEVFAPGYTIVAGGKAWLWTYTTTGSGPHSTWINADISSGDIGIVVNTTTNTGYSTIQNAIDAASTTAADTIALGADMTVTSQINIGKALTLDGNGHTLHATFAKTDNSNNSAIGITHSNVTVQNLIEDGTGSTNLHGINIYQATGVNLNGVTVSNNGRDGVVVNGSTVAVNTINTSNNGWGGIDVDQGSGVTATTTLTVNGTSIHSESGAAIFVDDTTKTVSVVDTNNQYSFTSSGNARAYALRNTVVTTEAQLRTALGNSLVSTITLGADIALGSELDITRSVTIEGANHKITATFNNASVIQITGSNVTLKNLTEDATGTTGNRGINLYKATGTLLDTVTVSNNSKNGIVVNGSTATVNNIVTSNNGWGGIDVDLGGGVTATTSLTVNGVSVHTEPVAQIFVDNITKPVSVTDTNSQYTASTTGNARTYTLNTIRIKTSSPTTATATSGGVTVSVSIPSDTIVTGNTSWNGVITPPAATTTTVTVSGFDTSVTSAIAVGSSDSDITFDKGVRLLFAGQAGKRIGWYNHAGTFTEITQTCSADSQSAGDALAAGGSCKIDVGGDLVVWTKHFSTFVAYTQTAVQTSSSGGGGNGAPVGSGGGGGVGGSVIPTLPSSNTGTAAAVSSGNTGGEVLGAVTYNFTKNLTVGSRGTDVTELQKVLIAAGLLKISTPTGWFGPMTLVAVKAFQKAHGIPATGFVGILTRTALNKGV